MVKPYPYDATISDNCYLGYFIATSDNAQVASSFITIFGELNVYISRLQSGAN